MAKERDKKKKAPTRRQFVSGVLIGAAACSSSGQKPASDASVATDAASATDGSKVPGVDQGQSDSMPPKKSGADIVTLGSTGIRVSRLAMGSGSNGTGGASDQ